MPSMPCTEVTDSRVGWECCAGSREAWCPESFRCRATRPASGAGIVGVTAGIRPPRPVCAPQHRDSRHACRAGRRAGVASTPIAGNERACCCPAKPMVTAVMAPTARRPYPVDLLLCGHHYRVSQAALRAMSYLQLVGGDACPSSAVPAPVRDRFQILLEPSWGVDTLARVIPAHFRRSGGYGSVARCGLIAGPGPHRRTGSKQTQIDCPLDSLRAGRHPELPVYRPEPALYRVARNIKGGSHLTIGAGRQELQNAHLGSGQWLVKRASAPEGFRLGGAHLKSGSDQLLSEWVRAHLHRMLDQVAGHLGCGGDDRVEEVPVAGCFKRTAHDASAHRVAAPDRGRGQQ